VHLHVFGVLTVVVSQENFPGGDPILYHTTKIVVIVVVIHFIMCRNKIFQMGLMLGFYHFLLKTSFICYNHEQQKKDQMENEETQGLNMENHSS
jgi:hypothetical protein